MDPWTLGLIAALVVGAAALVYGALSDRARNRRARAEMLAPPNRVIPLFAPDAPAPQYLSELQARRAPAEAAPSTLSAADRDALKARLDDPDTTKVRAGWLTASFVTDQPSGWAVLDDPAVLVCAASVTSMRELLPVMERAAMSQRGLVIIAPSIAPDVLATLEVNVIQQKVKLLAVGSVDAAILGRFAERSGATIVERSDLQAGYLPSDHLGQIDRWVSDQRQSYLLGPRTESA